MGFANDYSASLRWAGLTVALKARMEKASRAAFLRAQGLPAELMLGLIRGLKGA